MDEPDRGLPDLRHDRRCGVVEGALSKQEVKIYLTSMLTGEKTMKPDDFVKDVIGIITLFGGFALLGWLVSFGPPWPG